MKQILIFTLLVMSAWPILMTEEYAGGGQQKPDSNTVEQELLRLEREWLNAYEGRDVAAMERIVADDFTLTFGDGSVIDKAQAIADLKRPGPIDSTLKFSTEDVKVRVYGDTAILTGRVIEKRQRQNRDAVSESRYTDTYVRRQGRWQVVASHLSRLPPKRTAITVDPKIYDLYVGQYELTGGRVLTLTREGNALMSQPTGQPKFELFPESETSFFLKGPDVQLVFVKDKDGRVTNLVLREGGQNVRVSRKIN